MGLGTRLRAGLRALFGPARAGAPDGARDERALFDARWREQEAALDVLHAELALARRRRDWQGGDVPGGDVQGYGGRPDEGEAGEECGTRWS